ncbi:MAG: CAP domain-containing protein [Candidatus Shapirobacteria bacterium]|nr:CAP domain-containing protein [Candidatus Shapirobacteria bacterium]
MKHLLSSLFVPQERNSHRASILRPHFLSFLIIFYLFNQTLIKSFTIVKPGVLGYSSEITAAKVFYSTNLERQKNGLPPLHFRSLLANSAKNKTQDMFTHNYWAHTSPEGKTPWDFFKSQNYEYTVAGENLAKDYYDTESMMTAWMQSPTHKENIVNPKYKEIGIGVADGVISGIKTTLVAQHFGTPVDGIIANNTTEEIELNSHPFGLSNESQVLAQTSTRLAISPLFISKLLGSLMFLILIFALLVDAYITLRNGTHRISGSSAGHLGFLLIIFIFLIYSQQGKIF